MSTNFSTNQYEGSFLPHKLQNYEVPNQFKQHPSSRKGHTEIITNDRGHIILPNRRSSARPWGHFVGTWQAPRKPVQLKVKTKIMTSSYQRPVSAPASVSLSQKDGNDGRKSSSPDHVALQTIEETEQPIKEDTLNQSLPTSSNGSRPSSSNKSKGTTTHHSSPLPHTPTALSTAVSPPVTNRPDAPTPSDRTKLSPSVNSNHEGGNQTGALSRASSAPPSRLSHNGSRTPSRTATPVASGTRTPTATGSGSSYRPHSRQVSYEGSGIGTSHGLRVYTPLTPEGTTRSHTAAGSCNTPSVSFKDKEIQCPSI